MRRMFSFWVWTSIALFFYAGIAMAEVSDNGNASAKQLLFQAIRLGSELTPPGAQIDLYRTIAGELAAMRDMSEAVQLSQTFDVKRGRDDVLLWAVQGALRENRIEQAIETAKLIEGEYEHDSALSAIALFHAEAGNFTDAVAIISTMTSGAFNSHTLSLVVPFMVRAGHLNDAIDAALGLEDNHSKAQVISSIVAEQFKLGDTEAARKTATEFTAKIHNQWPILALSNSQARAGMITEAKETASQLNEQLHFFALGHIAEALAESGEASQALNLASSIPSPLGSYENSPTTRYRTIRQIVQIQAQRGDYTGALSTALTIPSTMSACDICESLRGEAIGEIGNAQAERGDYDLAIRTAERQIGRAHV